MRARTLRLEAFLNATRGSSYLRDNNPQIQLDGGKDYEVTVCPSAGIAFVHIYKAAGTTGKRLIDQGCREPRHHYSCCGCLGEGQVVCHMKDPDGDIDWAANVTRTFAFIRDPMERFQSGIFELARRNDPWIMPLLKTAEVEHREVADVVIDDLQATMRIRPIPNPHIMPQTFFLNDAGRPVKHLTYIARVGPQFDEEMQALGLDLFGLLPKMVARLPRYNAAHNTSFGRHRLYIHDESLSLETRIKIYDYYRLDYAWMGGLH